MKSQWSVREGTMHGGGVGWGKTIHGILRYKTSKATTVTTTKPTTTKAAAAKTTIQKSVRRF